MKRTVMGFSTRSLLVCVVLGAFTAVLVHLSRILGVLFWSVAPWIGAPAPVIPWFLTIIMASLLIPRFGSALITSIIGTIAGVGAMALLAGIVTEIVFAIARATQRRRLGLVEDPGARSGLPWAVLAGVLAGVMSYGFMFQVAEFRVLSGELMLIALAIRVVTGAVWGFLAYLIVRGLLRAGLKVDPSGREGAPARTATPDAGVI